MMVTVAPVQLESNILPQNYAMNSGSDGASDFPADELPPVQGGNPEPADRYSNKVDRMKREGSELDDEDDGADILDVREQEQMVNRQDHQTYSEGTRALSSSEGVNPRSEVKYQSSVNGEEPESDSDNKKGDSSSEESVAEEWEDASAGLHTATASIAEAATRNHCM
jgi:hypothetical protein